MKRSAMIGADIRCFFGSKRSCQDQENTDDEEDENNSTSCSESHSDDIDNDQSLLHDNQEEEISRSITVNTATDDPSTSSTQTEPSDIGKIITPSDSVDQVCTKLNKLTREQKFNVLFRHISPPKTFPSTLSHGCQRRFNLNWLEKYPWLRYSPLTDAIYCGPCAVLLPPSKRSDKGVLVNKPFSKWVKISGVSKNHSQLAYHRDAVILSETLKMTIENPSRRIDVMTNRAIQTQMERNGHILRQIVRAILFLGKQGLAFRCNVEDLSFKTNPGNFLALLSLFAESDPILMEHLQSPAAKNATYLSPESQNDIIQVIGCDIVRANIIKEVKKAPFYSVMADEVSCHNVEHLPICLRFVDEQCNIREDFITFVKLNRVRAQDEAEAIISSLESVGLSLNELRGQGYDGASTMSGEKNGVQKRIRDKQSKALYTHCAGHSLNLAITSSCSTPTIRNCIDIIKGLTLWIKYSPKRDGLLKAVVQKNIQDGASPSRTPILNVCITRWVENIDGWERFCLAHPFLIQMLEAIVYGNVDFPLYNDSCWTAEDKRNALAHLKAIESFEFLYALVTLQRSLMYLKQVVVKIQGPNQDIVSGIALIQDCCSELSKLRENVEDYSQRIFQHTCRLAEKSKIVVSKPRICQRQQHRFNIASDESVESYMKVSVTIPFLDHLISDLSCRFDKHSKKVSMLQGLLPCKIQPSSSLSLIYDAVSFYEDDLPNSLILDEEFYLWKCKWLNLPTEERPCTLEDTMKLCDAVTFPNIFTLLKLFATLPLSSCSCERSASTLRLLHTYLLSSQTEQRLTSLALIHTHYTTSINLDHVCKLFIEKHPRRMQLSSLLFD